LAGPLQAAQVEQGLLMATEAAAVVDNETATAA
jgi:hypothetical protein